MFSEEVDWCYRFHAGRLGRRLLPRRRGRARRRSELEEGVRSDVPRAGSRPSPLPRRPQGDEGGRAGAPALPRRPAPARPGSFPKERRATYRHAADWLSSGSVSSLLQSEPVSASAGRPELPRARVPAGQAEPSVRGRRVRGREPARAGGRLRGRLGQRPRRDPLARSRRHPGGRGRPPRLRHRLSFLVRLPGHGTGSGRRRGGVHRGDARARRRARPAGAGLSDARRAPELARAPSRGARRALPLPVPGLGRAGAAAEQAPPDRGRGIARAGRAANAPSALARRVPRRRARDRLPRAGQALRQHPLQAHLPPPGIPLRAARRPGRGVREGGAVRADAAGVHPGRRRPALDAWRGRRARTARCSRPFPGGS